MTVLPRPSKLSATGRRATSLATRLALLAAVALGASGCAQIDKLLGIEPKIALRELSVSATLGANSDSATALDIVFAFDDTTRDALPKTGPEWFAAKQALLAGYGPALAVTSLQVPPATNAGPVALPDGFRRAVAVYSYANYIAATGQPRGSLTLYRCTRIVLGPAAVAYQNCSSSNNS